LAIANVTLMSNTMNEILSAGSGYCYSCSQLVVPTIYGAGHPTIYPTDNYTWKFSFTSPTSIQLCPSRIGGEPFGTWGDDYLAFTYVITYHQCTRGQYINQNFICTPCPAGFYGAAVPLVSSMCSGPCAPGTYSTLGSTACSSQCPLGQYKSGGSCLSCSGSEVVSVDSTGCVSSCPAGQYSDGGIFIANIFYIASIQK
jgi:hypothetical protein